MQVRMVCLEDGIIGYGFRKMAAFVERLNPDTSVHYISTNVNRSMAGLLFARYGGDATVEMVDEMAEGLAGCDLLGFSSMTGYADLTKRVIRRVKEISPHTMVVWGGIHPIIHPEDALDSGADAICTGEGELAFEEFFDAFSNEQDYYGTRNFWFKRNGDVVRNDFLPLMTAAQMESLPFAKYAGAEKIYKRGKGFVPVRIRDYLGTSGLAYNTVWSIGCPFRCAYCGNTKFIENDATYRSIRHTSPRYIVDEVKNVLRVHPHVSTINFHDDSFLALPKATIYEFAKLWKEELQAAFAVYGVIPNYVREDKLRILTWAGMNRVRMGIQSGSKRILDFYRRPTPIHRIEEAASVLSKFRRFQVPPAYDVIVDNPIETREDVKETLELAYRLARPYIFYIYSLKVIPNTDLEKLLKEEGKSIEEINSYYTKVDPSIGNCLLFLISFWRPPRWLFDRLLNRVRACHEPQKKYPGLLFFLRALYLFKRGIDHLRLMDFSVITGAGGYLFWKLGIISAWRTHLNPKLSVSQEFLETFRRPARPSAAGS